jgi:hypothetical protein
VSVRSYEEDDVRIEAEDALLGGGGKIRKNKKYVQTVCFTDDNVQVSGRSFPETSIFSYFRPCSYFMYKTVTHSDSLPVVDNNNNNNNKAIWWSTRFVLLNNDAWINMHVG